MLNKGYNFIRRSLCFFNLFCWISGCCLIGIGTWLAISDYQYFRILPSYHFLSADNLILFCGITITFIAFLGCCGSWFESKLLLHCYIVLILVIMIIEILIGSLGFFYRHNIHKQLKYELLIGIKEHYNETDINGMKYTWDVLQKKLNCCGVKDYNDWYKIKAWKGMNKLPGSCCIQPRNHSIIYDPKRSDDEELYCNSIHENGCFKKINVLLFDDLYLVGVAFLIFAFIQFLVFIMSNLIICTIRSKKNYFMQNNHNSTYNRVPVLE